jgi:MraZ protein
MAGRMDEFVSTFTNRIDGKGRVSIPAPFREVLLRDGFPGLYCSPTLDQKAVDAGGNRFRDAIRLSLSQFDPFSEDYELLSTALMGESEILSIDKDGRTVFPDSIRGRAGLTDLVTFVGQGFKFQIWEPSRFAAYREEAASRVRELRKRLGARGSAGVPPGAGT